MTPRQIIVWLKDEKNRAVVTMIGAAFTATLGGLWTAYVYFFPRSEPRPKQAPTQIEFDCSSVAVGGDVSGATITARNSGDCAKLTPRRP